MLCFRRGLLELRRLVLTLACLALTSPAFAICKRLTTPSVHGAPQFLVCDTEAELSVPPSREGDLSYTKDSDKLWKRTASAWVEIGAGGGGPATWGDIGGDPQDQLDMMALFDGKQALGNYSGIGGCSANQFVTTLNEDTAPTCAAPIASTVLDTIGSTRGAILYRGVSGWAILVPGTLGDVLTSNGAGADPTYQTPAGGGGGLSHAQVMIRASYGF